MLRASHITPRSLPGLLRASDVLSIQVPLTTQTRDLLGSAEFAQMPKTAILVNVSRGEVIVEEALITALRQHQLAGAALDVVRGEPHPNPRLFSLDNLILTPHIAGYTREADQNIALGVVQNFLRDEKGHQ